MRRRVRFAAVLLVSGLLAVCAEAQTAGGVSGPWVMGQSRTTAGLRGIHAVSAKVAWASGTGGTILRTVDGGATWQRCATPPGAEKLDFRGIWAWDAQTAIAMSSGPGDLSRLYKTTDGCKSWKLVFMNPDKDGFWDAMVMTGNKTGLVIGDPVEGGLYLWKFQIRRQLPFFPIFATWDEGDRWHFLNDRYVFAVPGKGGSPRESIFAASNSSMLEIGSPFAWLFVTGGGRSELHIVQGIENSIPLLCKSACSLSSETESTLASGPTAGGFSIASAPDQTGIPVAVVVGGDYMRPNDSTGTAATCIGSMQGFLLRYQCQRAATPPHGFRSAVAWDAELKAWIAAGTNGSDISYDNGKTWVAVDNGNWNALSLPWVVGPGGRIGKLDPNQLKR